jgi:hypothetical protein
LSIAQRESFRGNVVLEMRTGQSSPGCQEGEPLHQTRLAAAK